MTGTKIRTRAPGAARTGVEYRTTDPPVGGVAATVTAPSRPEEGAVMSIQTGVHAPIRARPPYPTLGAVRISGGAATVESAPAPMQSAARAAAPTARPGAGGFRTRPGAAAP